MNDPRRNVFQLLNKLESKIEKFRTLMHRNRSNHTRNLKNTQVNPNLVDLISTTISIKISRSGCKVPIFLPTFNDSSSINQKKYPLESKPETSHKQFKIRRKSMLSKRICNSGLINRSDGISIPFGMILKSSPRNQKSIN